MIKVLIIDDEENGVISAKAGLIPISKNKKISEIDVFNRASLAGEIFNVKVSNNIKSAIVCIKEFLPDLVIIDINLKNEIPVLIDGIKFENGIHIYRYLNDNFKSVEKILFSNNFNVPEYMNELTIEERNNFISKAREAGHGILAGRISSYLKNVSISIISNIDPEAKRNYLKELKKQSWKTLEDYNIKLINKREIASKSLCVYFSHPILVNNKAELFIENPIQELENLFTSELPDGKKSRKEWKQDVIEDVFTYINNNHQIYYPKINSITEQIIDAHINRMDLKANLRIDAKVEFLLPSYIKSKATYFNEDFKNKFINALAVRRVLIFFESFIRKNIESQSKTPIAKWKTFFNKMPNEVLVAVFKKEEDEIGKAYINQMTISLNIGIKKPKDVVISRQKVDIDDYIIYDFEKNWLYSAKCEELEKQLKKVCMQ